MSIYNKLSAIDAELFVPKGQKNDFGKYNYRSCEDILKVVKPLCAENGCVLYITNDLVNIGNRNYVKAVATLVDIETGEQIQSVAHACEEETKKGMDGSQITGSSSSYARKYALAGLFCIDNEKDSDATNTKLKDGTDGAEKPKAQEIDPVKEAELKTKVLKYINKHNVKPEILDAWNKKYKFKSVHEWDGKLCQKYLDTIIANGGSIED